MGPLLTIFSNPLPIPLLTRPLKNDFYRHFGVSEFSCHTNRSLKLPSLRHFQDQFLTANKEKLSKDTACVSQGLCFWRFAGHWHRTIRIRIRIAAESRDTMPLSFCVFGKTQGRKTKQKTSLPRRTPENHCRDHGKGGLSLRGVAFMTVLAVLTALPVLETQWRAPCPPYKIQNKEATVTVLAVMAVSVVTATPP